MTTAEAVADDVIQAATFYVGDLLLGIDIRHVREINHLRSYTRVPQAAPEVLGVVNLRGEVVTVLELGRLMNHSAGDAGRKRRIVVVNDGRECIGLLVDSVADILSIPRDELDARPENVDGADARYIQGVHLMKQGLLVLLDVREVLAVGPSRSVAG
jgi:purine-binding chemotaxis protein CheW